MIPPAARGRGFEPQRSRLKAENRARPYPEGRPGPLAITDRSLPPVLPRPVAPPPPAPALPTNGPVREANYTELYHATQARASSAASAGSQLRERTPRRRRGEPQLALMNTAHNRSPSSHSLLRPPSVEVGRAPASSLAPSQRSASHNTVASSHVASSRSGSAVSRVTQRSSAMPRERTRSPYGERASSSIAVPILRPTRALSVAASVGQGSSRAPSHASRASSSDYARGRTSDKRYKNASGQAQRASSLHGRRAPRTIYNEIQARE